MLTLNLGLSSRQSVHIGIPRIRTGSVTTTPTLGLELETGAGARVRIRRFSSLPEY